MIKCVFSSHIARTDFTSIVQVVTFDSSDTEAFVTVPITEDDELENTEHFFGELRRLTNLVGNVMIFESSAQVDIIDNDCELPVSYSCFCCC